MTRIEFDCRATIIGSMPHTDPDAACAQTVHYLKDIPAWPQLPRRSFRENMYAQYCEGFPGIVVNEEEKRIYVDRTADLTEAQEKLYTAYLDGDFNKFPISPDYASGLHAFLNRKDLSPWAVKGQVVGPVTWGLTVADEGKRPIIYDELLGDAVAKLLRLKAGWMEKRLQEVSKNTIIFFDEPYMSAFGSVGMMLDKEQIINMLEEVFGGVSSLTGVHCCGNTDWSILLATSLDILSFDAYNYAESLTIYPNEVKEFLNRGGAIAWGIVPSDEEPLAKESAASLQDRLEEAMTPFTRQGITLKQLIKQGLLTPSCGLASLSTEEIAARALELLADLSSRIRKRHH